GTLLTLNRGEGGQNAMSGDLYDALGLVRTQELMSSDRYYGVHQYWTRVIDYGASKMGLRSGAVRCGASGADDAAPGDYVRVRRRADGWSWQPPGGRTDGAGGLSGRGRPEPLP